MSIISRVVSGALVAGCLLSGLCFFGTIRVAQAQTRCPALHHRSLAPQPADPNLLAAHRFSQGAGVKIAVIDTGVYPHPRLGEVIPGGDLVGNTNGLEDCDRHGTIVAGIIAARPAPTEDSLLGVAPAAEIISIRQTTKSGEDAAGTLAGMAKAIEKALEHHAGVINLSVVACLSPARAATVDLGVLNTALAHAEANNAVVVAAAGNRGQGCESGDIVFPAHSNTVVGVAALDPDGKHTTYSLSGPHLLAAPGHVPLGLSPLGDPRPVQGIQTDQGDQPWEGTSFAAPVISGIAALLKERYPTETAAQLRQRMYSAAWPANGELDPLRALGHLPGPTTVEDTETRSISLPAPQQQDPRPQQRTAFLLVVVCGFVILGWLVNDASRSTGPEDLTTPQSPNARNHKPGR
ncbi:type VII secretion-associated serine protease mycosin [Corynebacterium sp. 3HC-13]|uniref:type VII secretion-associated serine protease mycosin n=1 Tax=Corynebacterium poyangense TaxID=2684405 RepID=UPI001CCA9782|nr:type VII secretion-associated serine protease mycosin [Corynebacterium poyangense]MBZ8176754.1 type VII secretion-associated serine protease mycosin [Corynebacterium poyangense]